MIADEPVVPEPEKPAATAAAEPDVQAPEPEQPQKPEPLPALPGWIEQLLYEMLGPTSRRYTYAYPRFVEIATYIQLPEYNNETAKAKFLASCIELAVAAARLVCETDEFKRVGDNLDYWPLVEAYVAESMSHMRRGTRAEHLLTPAMERARTAYTGTRKIRSGRIEDKAAIAGMVAVLAELAEAIALGEIGDAGTPLEATYLVRAVAKRVARYKYVGDIQAKLWAALVVACGGPEPSAEPTPEAIPESMTFEI